MLQLNIDRLNALAINLNNNYTKINWGGCAFIARFMYKRLYKFVDTQILFLQYDNVTKEHDQFINNVVKQKKIINMSMLSSNGLSCHHAIISFTYKGEQWMFDTDTGVELLSKYLGRTRLRAYYMDYQAACSVTDYNKCWNSVFPRFQVEQIEHDINNQPLFDLV